MPGTGKRFRGAARRAVCLLVALAGLTATPAAAQQPGVPAGANDYGCKLTAEHPRPVVLVHGLGARADANWSYVSPRLAAAGYCVFALTYGVDDRTEGWPYRPGGTIRMQRSSRELKRFVRRVRVATGARKVDLVGHSEGTVMPRWYLERRNGARRVYRFVALTPLWRGTNVAAAATLRDLGARFGLDEAGIDLASGFCASCPQFLRGSRYLRKLNADGEKIPGVRHTNIATRYDELVRPPSSGIMRDGGTSFFVQDVCPANVSEHGAVAFDPAVMQMILNALKPRTAKPVPC